MKRIILLFSTIGIILVILGTRFAIANNHQNKGYTPPKGFVPNQETAIKIAEAIWLPIYGKEIEEKKPFVAHLQGDTLWIVEGTLKGEMIGGVPHIEIMKNDCRVLEVSHGK
ncbi:MAG: YbbC/YhhH family protein [Bacteroidota bacterium]